MQNQVHNQVHYSFKVSWYMYPLIPCLVVRQSRESESVALRFSLCFPVIPERKFQGN